jgi:hypothetical protein
MKTTEKLRTSLPITRAWTPIQQGLTEMEFRNIGPNRNVVIFQVPTQNQSHLRNQKVTVKKEKKGRMGGRDQHKCHLEEGAVHMAQVNGK